MVRCAASASARAVSSRTRSRKRPDAYEKGGPAGVPLSFAARPHPSVASSLTQQFDPGRVGAIADAVSQLHDPGIAAGARREAFADLGEQLVRHVLVLEAPLHEAPRVQVAA